MNVTDVLSVGAKLLGTYFAVVGLVEMAVFAVRLLLANLGWLGLTMSAFNRAELVTFSAAVVYLAAAFVLMRHTTWWVGTLLGSETEEAGEETEEFDEEGE